MILGGVETAAGGLEAVVSKSIGCAATHTFPDTQTPPHTHTHIHTHTCTHAHTHTHTHTHKLTQSVQYTN